MGRETGDWFATTIGRGQGDPISPNTFITYLERVMENIQDNGTGVSGTNNNLRFAADVDLLENSWDTGIDCKKCERTK